MPGGPEFASDTPLWSTRDGATGPMPPGGPAIGDLTIPVQCYLRGFFGSSAIATAPSAAKPATAHSA